MRPAIFKIVLALTVISLSMQPILAVETYPMTVKRADNGCNIELIWQIGIEALGETDSTERVIRDDMQAAYESCMADTCLINCTDGTPACTAFTFVDVQIYDSLGADTSKYFHIKIRDWSRLISSAIVGVPNQAIAKYTDDPNYNAHGVWRRNASANVYCHETLHLAGLLDKYCGIIRTTTFDMEAGTYDSTLTYNPVCPDPPGPVPCDCSLPIPLYGNRCTKPCTGAETDLMANVGDTISMSCTDHILVIVASAGLNSCPAQCCPQENPPQRSVPAETQAPLGSTTPVPVRINRTLQDVQEAERCRLAQSPEAMSVSSVDPGSIYDICEWEYFDWEIEYDETCEPDCQMQIIITAIPDYYDDEHEPLCYGPPDEATYELAVINYVISEDPGLAGNYYDLKFFWKDCEDNSIDAGGGRYVYIDQAVLDPYGDIIWDEYNDVDYPESSRPANVGTPDTCLSSYSPPYVCADANGDEAMNIADASFIISAIFFGGGPLPETGQADANSDGTVNIADASFIVNAIFFGGASPSCGQNAVRGLEFQNGSIIITE